MPIKFVGEPLCVSKEFWYGKLSSKGGGSFTVLSKFFFLTGSKKLRQGTIWFHKISRWKKYFMDKRGVSRFPVESFCLNLIFHWRTLWCFRKILLSKIFMHRRGASRFFVSQDRNEKLCKGTLLFSGKFFVSKKFMDKRGHITICSRNFYVSQCRKFS